MKPKYSTLKIHIFLFLTLWFMLGASSTLAMFKLKGYLFYLSLGILSLLFVFLIYKRYIPFMRESKLYAGCIICAKRIIDHKDLLKAYEVNPLEKIFFALKSPQFDFSSSFFKKGVLLKTRHGSYLIDNCGVDFIEYKKVRKVGNKSLPLIPFYLSAILPLMAWTFWSYIRIDILIYMSSAMVVIIILIMRFLPPFYLGQKIDNSSLPLSYEELREFKGINIIEGFALSDDLAAIPFKKGNHLDGLAVNVFFKKYIVLNSRLFALDSQDYLRFVLFHELCHIKHYDGSDIFILTAFLGLVELTAYVHPLNVWSSILSNSPYYDYAALVIVILYIGISLFRRKNIERRADRYGAKRIGKEGISNIHEKLGYNLRERI